MKYATVCSGIEAPTVAWHPLGWKPQFFSEIEPFPSAVLAHHFPNVPNLGDMTRYAEWPDYELDLICAGCPCQAFSFAGLRKGLADPRGNLTLTFLGIIERYRPRWLVYENVAGILSSTSHDAPDPSPPPAPLDMECDGQEVDTEDEYSAEELHALNCFLAGLSELGYGWAMRVLDAQHFGVPQRRRRVFVVGHSGGQWQRPFAALFERSGLQGHSPPSRGAGQEVTGTISGRTQGGGGLGTDFECSGGLVASLVARCVTSRNQRIDAESETLILFDTTQITSATGRSNPKAGDPCHTPLEGSHPPAIAYAFTERTRASGRNLEMQADMAYALTNPGSGGRTQDRQILQGTGVRRLTTLETERLQGLPENWTRIPWRGKPAESCPDSPRYRAVGNSMAVPCVRWIGERIEMVDKLFNPPSAPR